MVKKKWTPTHNQTEAGFEVIAVRAADHKDGYVVTVVEYNSNHKQYTYCRKQNAAKDPFHYITVIDGCEVEYDRNYNVCRVERIYDTAGMKKQHNPGGAGKCGKSGDTVSDSIKAEMEQKSIEKPTVDVSATQVPQGEIHHEQYETIRTCLETNIPVYLAGPAGSGKNHTVEQICKELGWDFYFSNSVQQEYKLTGFIDAGGKYHDTEFYKAATSENDCVFFLDEMDASITEVLVLLNAAIANGYFEFPCGRVNLNHVHFVAAGNTVGSGADETYTGRMVLDQATLDRFAIIEFDYSIRIEMAISKGNSDLVSFIRQLREASATQGVRTTFSYRCIARVTKLENAGMDTVTILKISLFGGIDKDTINTFQLAGDSKYHEALRTMQRVA